MGDVGAINKEHLRSIQSKFTLNFSIASIVMIAKHCLYLSAEKMQLKGSFITKVSSHGITKYQPNLETYSIHRAKPLPKVTKNC